MLFKGSCKCNRWYVEVQLAEPLEALNPRICDCNYCQASPSPIISDPTMSAIFTGDGISTKQNGDQLADFYHCKDCNQLLAVGCNINSQLRGAVNLNLLKGVDQLGDPIQVQPRLLSADQKLERWGKLWGFLSWL